MTPDEQNQTNTTQEEEVMPGLSTTSNAPIQDLEKKPDNFNQKRTRLHEVANEIWGCEWLDNDAFAGVIKYADPDMAKKNKTGFMLELLNGKKITYDLPSQRNPNERISGPNRGFDQDTAAAMVTLARLRGWKTMNVEGTVEQKGMLWLAVQRQNLLEMEAFERDQKEGKIPKTDKDGKPITYRPLTVTNFVPLADSPFYQQYLQDKADYDAKHAPIPELTQDISATETPVPVDETKKTEPEKTAKKTEEKKPEEKKPEAENQKTEKKSAVDSKFVGKGKGNQFSSKFNKVQNKPHNTKTHHKHRGSSHHKPH